MTTRQQPWHESLFDSVHALGAAARECQRAHRAAVIARDHVDLDRIRLLDGKILRRSPSYAFEQEPHLTALSRIGQAQLELEQQLQRLYEEAARAYAHGAAWAVTAVVAGRQPAHVEVPADTTHYGRLPELNLSFTQGPALEDARRAYERCLDAAEYAEDLGGQPHLSDYEAGEMHRALDAATHIADAAYAYGVLAESAYNFVTRNARTAPPQPDAPAGAR
ncbi:hypothetical protein [Streptomyces griseosporeus]|uniref:hypothetical protein n=1 Tax=Streptomyces griseosporeus TaxID=1910 RepID=UPI0036FFAD16